MEKFLEVCKESSGVTKIVYQCNLNFYTVRLHLKRLTDAGLLAVSGSDQISHKTTIGGMKALEHINAFRSLLIPAANSACCPSSP